MRITHCRRESSDCGLRDITGRATERVGQSPDERTDFSSRHAPAEAWRVGFYRPLHSGGCEAAGVPAPHLGQAARRNSGEHSSRSVCVDESVSHSWTAPWRFPPSPVQQSPLTFSETRLPATRTPQLRGSWGTQGAGLRNRPRIRRCPARVLELRFGSERTPQMTVQIRLLPPRENTIRSVSVACVRRSWGLLSSSVLKEVRPSEFGAVSRGIIRELMEKKRGRGEIL